jgi:trimeric autotransporter adhesin
VLVTLTILGIMQLAAQDNPSGGTPRVVRYSGKVIDAQGKPQSGIAGATFSIYKDLESGAPLWMETQNVQADAKGNYTVLLGATQAEGLALDIFNSGDARWLGVRINGGDEGPRVQLLSVPYALKAVDAETIGGLPPSAFLRADATASKAAQSGTTASASSIHAAAAAATSPAVTGKGVANYIPMWNSASDIIDSVIFQKTSAVGINTKTPAATLDVNGKGNLRDTLTLYPKGADPTLAIQGSDFKIDSKGKITFAAGQTFPDSGTVSSVGLSAPSSDFTVSGSPVTTSGTLALNWATPPTANNTFNAIVKRDSTGNFIAGSITAERGLTAFSAAAGGNGVYGQSGSGAGIQGNATGDGWGVYGISGQGYGVYGVAQASAMDGVYGIAHNAFAGVVGIDDANGHGVWGAVTASGIDGVHGVSASSNGSGVAAENTSNGDGLYAYSSTGYAGFFAGDVEVDGNLSKAGGSFKIDHPLDPANKYLYHSFVESPDMMNIYNGNVTTDANGNALVTLPDWFEALNSDFRYQLTVIGQFAQAIVSRKVQVSSALVASRGYASDRPRFSALRMLE